MMENYLHKFTTILKLKHTLVRLFSLFISAFLFSQKPLKFSIYL